VEDDRVALAGGLLVEADHPLVVLADEVPVAVLTFAVVDGVDLRVEHLLEVEVLAQLLQRDRGEGLCHRADLVGHQVEGWPVAGHVHVAQRGAAEHGPGQGRLAFPGGAGQKEVDAVPGLVQQALVDAEVDGPAEEVRDGVGGLEQALDVVDGDADQLADHGHGVSPVPRRYTSQSRSARSVRYARPLGDDSSRSTSLAGSPCAPSQAPDRAPAIAPSVSVSPPSRMTLPTASA